MRNFRKVADNSGCLARISRTVFFVSRWIISRKPPLSGMLKGPYWTALSFGEVKNIINIKVIAVEERNLEEWNLRNHHMD